MACIEITNVNGDVSIIEEKILQGHAVNAILYTTERQKRTTESGHASQGMRRSNTPFSLHNWDIRSKLTRAVTMHTVNVTVCYRHACKCSRRDLGNRSRVVLCFRFSTRLVTASERRSIRSGILAPEACQVLSRFCWWTWWCRWRVVSWF